MWRAFGGTGRIRMTNHSYCTLQSQWAHCLELILPAPELRLWWLRKIARHKSMMWPVAVANKSMRVTLDGCLLQLNASGTN